MGELLSRSARVRRGFHRLALVGLAIGALTAGIGLVFAAAHYSNGLLVQTKAGYQNVPDEVSAEAGNRIQAQYGAPDVDYFARAVNSEGPEAYPFQHQLERQRQLKDSYVQQSLGMAGFGAFLGLFWAGFVLLVSWLIRGFMA